MFSDPATALMAMIMLCFGGMIIMFVFMIKSNATRADMLREALLKQQMVLADLEHQVMEMNFALRHSYGAENGQASTTSHHLRAVAKGEVDLAAILDAAAKNSQKLDLGNGLLPEPAISRPLVEEFDPEFDSRLLEEVSGEKRTRQQRETDSRAFGANGNVRSLSIRMDD